MSGRNSVSVNLDFTALTHDAPKEVGYPMQILDLVRADEEDHDARHLSGHYDELLSDFRRRMDCALKALREYEEAVRQGEYF